MTNRRTFILHSAVAAGLTALPIEGKTRSKDCLSISRDEMRIAETLVRARLEARLLTTYPGTVPDDLASAYRIQDAAIARWPSPIRGWKVSGRFAPSQEQLFGPAFEGSIRSADPGQVVECPVFIGGMGNFEPEVIVRVGQDAPPGQTVWRLVEAAELVGDLCIGAEVTSSPLLRFFEWGVRASVADLGGNYGIVVGSRIPNWRTLDEITARKYVGGKLVHEGTRPVRDGILEVFRSTLAHCAKRGYPLQAGMMIATGGIGGTVGPSNYRSDRPEPPAPPDASHLADQGIRDGETSRIVFDGLGEFTCRAVPATRHS